MADSSGLRPFPADKITAFATSMAAIAAIASGATAVLQLRATFNSQLYNQQIERVGTMVADSARQRDEAVATSIAAKALADQLSSEGGGESEKARLALFDQYNAKIDALRRGSYEFDVRVEQVGLVLPTRMDPLIRDMLVVSSKLKEILYSDMPLNCATGNGVSHCKIENVDKMVKQSTDYADHIDEDSAKIEWCAIGIIRNGHLLTNDNVKRCDLLPGAGFQHAPPHAR